MAYAEAYDAAGRAAPAGGGLQLEGMSASTVMRLLNTEDGTWYQMC